jgi:hypothetical protein
MPAPPHLHPEPLQIIRELLCKLDMAQSAHRRSSPLRILRPRAVGQRLPQPDENRLELCAELRPLHKRTGQQRHLSPSLLKLGGLPDDR